MQAPLSSEQWEQIQGLFDEVVDLVPAARAARLDEACRDDPALREEVESLLAAHVRADDVLQVLDQIGSAPSQPVVPRSSYTGLRIAQYEVLEYLGGGGMGVVYKALDTRLKRIVALKFLPPQWSQDTRAKQRFQHEAQAASALDHPNICTIYEIGETGDNRLFIAMAYYDGQTLKKKIKQGPLPLDDALDIAAQIAQGLAKAHTRDIVHRDVKPANIMLTDDGVVKLLDFGLAKMADVQLTKTGATMGTVAYMSPEQTKGEGVDHRADVWSLGIVLYEMLTGERPFKGDYDQAVIYSLLNENPASITERNAALPDALEHVVAMCLEKEPALRYPSADDLLADLEMLRQGVGKRTFSDAEADSGLYPMQRRRRFLRRTALLAGLGTLAILAVFLAMWPRLSGPSLPDQRHLAVLPFTLIETDSTEQIFADGLAETLRSKLAQFERFEDSLWVVPTDDMRRYRVTSPREAQQLFGANLALSGLLDSQADLVRLTLTLFDTKAQRALQSQMIEKQQTDISAFQEEILTTVTEFLDLDVPPQVQRALSAGGTTAPDANIFYLRGRGYLEAINKVDAAIQSFERALQADSAFALAYVGLAEAYLRKYDATRDPQWLEEATRYGDLALEQHDELADVYVTMGFIHTERGQYGSARVMFNEALTRNPVSAAALRGLAEIYEKSGDLEGAERAYLQAIALKPDYWVGYNELGIFYFNERRYEEAAERFQSVVDLTPDNPRGYNNLGAVNGRLGRSQEAFEWYLQSVEVHPTELAHRNLGSMYYREKKFAEAAQMFEKAVELEALMYANWGRLANAYYWAGQRTEARAAWQRMIELAEAQRAINPQDRGAIGALAGAYAKLEGREQEARAMIERLLALKRLNGDDLAGIARTYEILGARDLALQYFAQALEHGATPSSMERSPWMDDLRDDPRYKKMIESYLEVRE